MLFIIIHNSIYNMLFNYTPVSFTLSDILPLISFCSLFSLLDLSLISLLVSLCSLPLSLEREQRDRERKQGEIGSGREIPGGRL